MDVCYIMVRVEMAFGYQLVVIVSRKQSRGTTALS